MTQIHYKYNSEKVARKLIKACSAILLSSILAELVVCEEITDEDRAELEQLLDEVQ